MPLFTVEARDGRAYRIEAETAEAARREVADAKRLPLRVLDARPAERHRSEWSVRIFLAVIAAFTALGLILALL
ncbi:MAG: hypothetical protein AAF563_02000 [Pseudomonadota bacterium]